MGCFGDPIYSSDLDERIIYKYRDTYDLLFKDDDRKVKKAKMKQIELDDKRVTPKFKKKMEELISKRESTKPRIIAEGNYCSKPCYEYNTNILDTCPKCGGVVQNSVENEIDPSPVLNIYYIPGCCEKFTYKNLDKIDYDIDEFFKYFEKYDENIERYYIIIDGERFDMPKYLNFKNYLTANCKYFFPHIEKFYYFDYDLNISEYGKSLGYRKIIPGLINMYCALVFKCKKCNYEYHILRTFPFMYRDKNKDNIIIEKTEEDNNEEEKRDKNI